MATLDDVNVPRAKIVQLSDHDTAGESSDESFYDCDDGPEEVSLKFKQSVLKNRKMFQEQLMETGVFDSADVFEYPTRQSDNEVELSMEMERQTLSLPALEELAGKEEGFNKLVYLARSMERIPLQSATLDDDPQNFEGVFKKLVAEGRTGEKPPLDSVVTVNYNAYVEDEASGEIVSFDSTVLRGKAMSFVRGQGEVIAGLDAAVGSMRTGEKSEFIISPGLAYGSRGCPPRIPCQAYVYFKVELVEWIDSSDAEAFGKLPRRSQREAAFDVVLAAAKAEKRRATAFYEKHLLSQAARSYRLALHWLEDRGYADEAEERRGQKVVLALNLDLALVYLKLNRPKKTCLFCRDALLIDVDNAKAHYRLGLARHKLGESQQALQSLLRARRLCPNDPSIAKAILEINDQVRRNDYVERDLYARMLGVAKQEQRQTADSVDDRFKQWLDAELGEFQADAERRQMSLPRRLSLAEAQHLRAEAERRRLRYATRPSADGDQVCVVQKPADAADV